ncbi:MAG: hypothetical protein KDA30_09485 [Phycisphaerales bacterium]|nr:hypothetical protein [Phycisphaerales bacterium]
MTEQATRVSDQRRSAAIGVWIVSLLAAMVIANADRGYYTDAGYNTQIRPSYWGHAVLMAFYAGSAFMLARAPKWKSALVIAAALSFGLWSGFVVDAALGLQGTSAGDAFDAFIGRAGGSSLFAGIVAGGLATAVWFGVLTGRARVGFLIAGISVLCGVMAAFGGGGGGRNGVEGDAVCFVVGLASGGVECASGVGAGAAMVPRGRRVIRGQVWTIRERAADRNGTRQGARSHADVEHVLAVLQ